MYFKYYYFILASILICISSISCSMNCYVVTNNNDTLEGKLKGTSVFYLKPINGNYEYIVYKNKQLNKNIKIKRNDIKNIGVINKKNNDTSMYIIFNNYYWQLLAAKCNLGIYKRVYYSDAASFTTLEDIVIFAGNKQRFSIYHGYPLTEKFDNEIIDSTILIFINAQYNQNFSITYFKDEKAMYDYILDKEAELEKQENTVK